MDNKPPIDKCMIFIDKEGAWFHENKPIINEEIVGLFYSHLRRDEWGRYLIEWRGQICEVDVEDVPLVVKRVDVENHSGAAGRAVKLTFNDRSQEELNPDSLRVGDENVLYCSAREGSFEARFSRPAYYQFAELLEYNEDSGRYYIQTGSSKRALDGLS